MKIPTQTSYDSYIFTDEELAEIRDWRRCYEEMTERDKFLLKEALKPYFYGKRK